MDVILWKLLLEKQQQYLQTSAQQKYLQTSANVLKISV